MNCLYFDGLNHMSGSRQLPSASTLPGYPTVPTEPVSPITPTTAPILTNIGYTQAYLRTQIGKRVRIDFLIGTNTLIDRGGILEDVGISYVILRETETGNKVLGDLYSIKFVTFFEDSQLQIIEE